MCLSTDVVSSLQWQILKMLQKRVEQHTVCMCEGTTFVFFCWTERQDRDQNNGQKPEGGETRELGINTERKSYLG